MNKARITYRFDGDRREERRPKEEANKVIPLYEEEFRVVDDRDDIRIGAGKGSRQEDPADYQPLNQYTTDFGAWSSSYDAETQRIEELIRESNERRDAKRNWPEYRGQSDESPRQGYVPPETDAPRYNGETGYFESNRDYGYRGPVFEEGPVVAGPRYVRHSRPHWPKITAAVAGAAVTGVMLGFFVLSMFSDSKGSAGAGGVDSAITAQMSDDEALAVSDPNVVKDPAASGTRDISVSAGKEAVITYAGKTYAILQNGIFTSADGVKQAKSALLDKGFAAASEDGEKMVVYAGVATDRDGALMLSQQLKENNVEIYVKNYSVPSASKVRWNGDPKQLQTYLDQSDKLLAAINQLTLLHLEEATPTAIDDTSLESMHASHEAWSRASSAVVQEATEANRQLLQKMGNAMNSAKASLDEYKKNPSTAMLWQAQTYLMQFLVEEKALLQQIIVQE